jgi:hypothetical protein
MDGMFGNPKNMVERADGREKEMNEWEKPCLV